MRSRFSGALLLLLVLCLGLSVILPASRAQAQECKGEQCDGPKAFNFFNPRLAVQVRSDGRFNIGAFPDLLTGGSSDKSYNIMHRWPLEPWSSFTSVKIDGEANIYGSSGTQVQPPTDIDNRVNESRWQMGDILAAQRLEVVANTQGGEEDVLRIAYTLANTGDTAHQVGLRVMIDMEVNNNDGSPVRVPGYGVITREVELQGEDIPQYFHVFHELGDQERTAVATLKTGDATPPDRLAFAFWPYIYSDPYDYPVDPSTDLSIDAAYALYWEPVLLQPGDELTYVTYYGLGMVNVVLQPPLGLQVTAPDRLLPALDGYSPNPFEIKGVVTNGGAARVEDTQLSLTLPEGLSLSSGSAMQSIGTLDPGETDQVSWMVAASVQTRDTVLSYSITVNASETEQETIERQVTLPGISSSRPPLDYFALGDSIASGYGLMDAGAPCHLSESAYPHQLANQLSARYTVNFPEDNFLACSGAKAGYGQTLAKKDTGKWFRSQVDSVIAQLSSRPTLVTITLGSDDFDWTGINYYRRLMQPAFAYDHWLEQVRNQVTRELYVGVERLLAYPNVTVVITQVHNPYNQESRFFTSLPYARCSLLFGSAECYQRTNRAVESLNNGLITRVWMPLNRPARLILTQSLSLDFQEHAAPQPTCGTAEPGEEDTWLQYIGAPGTNSALPSLIERAWKANGKPGDCIHPNEQGAAAYAQAVADALWNRGW